MANNDRVADVYHRRADTTATQDACRARVHWLCQQAGCGRVLDVGCSQGISALILAREGREVVGLDIESEALAAAAEALAQEPPQVQQRVRFLQADAFTAALDPGSYDAALVAEVLEHLVSPERLLERVAEWLRDGGRLIVTVPHGYHPYHDHKRSFYVGTLVELLGQQFNIVSVELIAERFLGAVAVRPPRGEPPRKPTVEQLLAWERVSHQTAERTERQSYGDRLARHAQRRKLEERITELREVIARHQKTAQELQETLARQREAAQLTDDQHQRAMQELQEALTRQGAAAQAADDQHQQAMQALQEALARERQAVKEAGELQRGALDASRAHDAEELQNAIAREKEARTEALRRTEQAARLARERPSLEKARLEEQRRRRKAESRCERLAAQLSYYKADQALQKQAVRYRLGDAFVSAMRPSMDTLKLPFRILALLREGLRRRRTRAASAPRDARPAAAPCPAPVAPVFAPIADTAPSPSEPALAPPPPRAPAVCTLDNIPTLAEAFSNAPPELRRRNDLRIAAVTDEFSWRAWQYEADVVPITPKDWREVLEERKPDLLLVESAWSGPGNSWYFQIRDLGQRGDVIKHYALPDIVAWCRARDIPTVFYNKEDPPNFDVFVDAAKQFDFVFTSDANCIPAYRKHVGHERVYSLPFAAQPRIHNPVMTGVRTGSVCFAGTWYAHRHFDRQSDAEKILRPALDFDLHIFDRMANSDNPNYRWPEAFLPALRGALPYAQMVPAYKRYKASVNVNSVANSPTMFSRRVFELLACGTPVISSYSIGIEQLLGADVVLMSASEETTRALLEKVLSDDGYRAQLSLRGLRRVFGEHTYTHRLQTILNAVGLSRPAVGQPTLTMIAAVANAQEAAGAWENYRRQSYPRKRLLLCATDAASVRDADGLTGGDPSVSVQVAAGALWGRVLSAAVRAAPEYVVALHPRHHYGPHFLTDYAHATLYVTEPAIGKASHFQTRDSDGLKVVGAGAEYRVVSRVNPWTLCLTRAHAQQVAPRLISAQSPAEWWNRSVREVSHPYSADRFNYVQIGDDQSGRKALSASGSEPRAMELALA